MHACRERLRRERLRVDVLSISEYKCMHAEGAISDYNPAHQRANAYWHRVAERLASLGFRV
jgi:hypothetical protein